MLDKTTDGRALGHRKTWFKMGIIASMWWIFYRYIQHLYSTSWMLLLCKYVKVCSGGCDIWCHTQTWQYPQTRQQYGRDKNKAAIALQCTMIGKLIAALSSFRLIWGGSPHLHTGISVNQYEIMSALLYLMRVHAECQVNVKFHFATRSPNWWNLPAIDFILY